MSTVGTDAVSRPEVHSVAASHDEIKPLVNLCRMGKLFEVQDWIAEGKPVNPPKHRGGNRKKSPLEYAINAGFHSLVKVLLDGGADVGDHSGFCPMSLALEHRRFDIVKLLVEAGFDPKTVNMLEVFCSWDPEIMEYFIESGSDIETNHPIAHALCYRIRTVLRIVKKYGERYPCIQSQLDIALRYHCKEGNLKWISLLNWAGANPLSKGDANPYSNEVDDEDSGLSALGYAALYDHYEVFQLKQIKLRPDHPASRQLLGYCNNTPNGIALFEKLLKLGVSPNDQEEEGCSIIQHLVSKLDWEMRSQLCHWKTSKDGIDSGNAREYMKMIYLLAMHGGKWVPDSYEVKSARRSLLKMTPDYTIEFVWIMARFNACNKSVAETLLRTPTIKRHTKKHSQRLGEIFSDWAPSPKKNNPR